MKWLSGKPQDFMCIFFLTKTNKHVRIAKVKSRMDGVNSGSAGVGEGAGDALGVEVGVEVGVDVGVEAGVGVGVGVEAGVGVGVAAGATLLISIVTFPASKAIRLSIYDAENPGSTCCVFMLAINALVLLPYHFSVDPSQTKVGANVVVL